MKDVNYPLRKAYMLALDGQLEYDGNNVPVYYQMAPDTEESALYAIINGHSNNSNGTVSTQDNSSTVSLTIHSFGSKYSDGVAVDDVAGQVLGIILPDPSTVIDLSADNLQVTGIELASDNVQDYSSQGERIYIDRVLVFRHQIFNN